MKKKNILLVIVILLVVLLVWIISNRRMDEAATAAISMPVIKIQIDSVEEGFPYDGDPDTIVRHAGFDLSYNEKYEQASWVAYILTREEVESGSEERTDNFRPDTAVITGSAVLKDYAGSGYDRGHLAPAADMKWSAQAMSESFLLSNMSPQVPGFNRGVWSRLEAKVREWAVENDSLLVITGPVLEDISTYIGDSHVGVPGAYFKIIADISSPEYKVIAFLLENNTSGKDIFSFAVTVDSVEKVTGFDFFSKLPDQDMVEWFESRLITTGWK